jgi:hypothetical protein
MTKNDYGRPEFVTKLSEWRPAIFFYQDFLLNKIGQLKDWVGQVLFLVSCPKGQVKKIVNVEACPMIVYLKSFIFIAILRGNLGKSIFNRQIDLHLEVRH